MTKSAEAFQTVAQMKEMDKELLKSEEMGNALIGQLVAEQPELIVPHSRTHSRSHSRTPATQ